MSTLTVPMPDVPGDHVLLHGVDWETYTSVLEQVGERRLFVTFDGENLEIMSPSPEHDNAAEAFGVIIRLLAEELDIPIRGLGSTTFRNAGVQKGIEPDRCYYTRNEPKVRGKRRLDLRDDPPPDLAVEIEITRRLLDRESIYVAFRVPEIWRYDGARLRVFALVRGRYVQRPTSPTFPTVPLDRIEAFVGAGQVTDESTWLREMRRWVRKHLVGPTRR